MPKELRVSYNKENFLSVFYGEERKKLEQAASEPSLLDLINHWLGRTPGITAQTFDFWSKFKVSVQAMLKEMKATAEVNSPNIWA